MAIEQVPVYAAKTRLAVLLGALGQGEQVTIRRRAVVVARLAPLVASRRAAASQRQQVADACAQLGVQRAGVESSTRRAPP
jgi:antitoxin (DNA-binding transcriptional repressor) of toxin-antitoxin stability system